MAFYMHQWKYAQPAMKAMVDNPQNREDASRKIIEAFGGTLHQFFFSFGHYDGLAITEYPDDESSAAAAMAVATAGAVTNIETTKLMTAEEAKGAMQRVKTTSSGYKPPQG